MKINLEELLEQKDFASLSTEEQNFVLQLVSKEEYQLRREIVLAAKNSITSNSKIEASDQILNDLLKHPHLNQSTPKALFFHSITSKKVSVVTMAAAMLLVFFGSYFLWYNTGSKVEYITQDRIVEKVVYDTIKIVEEVPVEKLVNQVVYQTIEKPKPNIGSPEIPLQSYGFTEPNNNLSLEDVSNSFGNSSINEDELEQFKYSL